MTKEGGEGLTETEQSQEAAEDQRPIPWRPRTRTLQTEITEIEYAFPKETQGSPLDPFPVEPA